MAEQSLGEKRVRVNFNVDGVSMVDVIKRETAALIDICKAQMDATADGETKRLCAEAMTLYETACMFAVKAVTA